jgi:hypothetical protein
MSSTVNANLAADTTAWHAMTVDAVAKRLATDLGERPASATADEVIE